MSNHEPRERPQGTYFGTQPALTPETEDLIHKALASARADDQGWVDLAPLGAAIKFLRPDFDPARHGFQKLSDLLAACSSAELRRDERGRVLARPRVPSAAQPQAAEAAARRQTPAFSQA